MNLRVLFIILLCLFSAFIIYNPATITLNATEGRSLQAFTNAADASNIANDGPDPMGDPIGGDGWP